MVPIPRAASWEALNEQFVRDAMARRAQRLRGHKETIGERFERDRAVLLPLPAARFEACDKTTARVSSISLVRYRTNDYSVPTQYGHRQVLVKALRPPHRDRSGERGYRRTPAQQQYVIGSGTTTAPRIAMLNFTRHDVGVPLYFQHALDRFKFIRH